jgi:hypothetical protein
MIKVNNSFMTDPQYLSQIGHFLGGGSLILITALFFGFVPCFYTFSAIIVLASIKEFWYDMKYEIDPKQTWSDSIMDFSFYILGGLVGIAFAFVSTYVGILHK